MTLPPDPSSRLAALRREMAAAGYDGFLVPMADAYQSEYVPPSDQRIAFLSGFTGSAGYIVVLSGQAAFFTDSRYTLQAAQQLPQGLFDVYDTATQTPSAWLAEHVEPGAKIAYDPWLHTADGADKLKTVLAQAGRELVPSPRNLVDLIWDDRPAEPREPVRPHDMAYAGKTAADKRADMAEILKKKGAGAAVLTDPASLAWLLNVRGNDVPNTPLPLSRAILRDDASVVWFLDSRKVTDELAAHAGAGVSIVAPETMAAALDDLARQEKLVLIDTAHAACAIVERIRAAGVKILSGEDPCELPRACKNAVEIEGMRAAHRRDGAALAKFFAWLDGAWRQGGLTELAVEEKLASFREANNNYRSPSFETIAGAGEHGAVIHYRARRDTDAPLQLGQLFLLDSGAQYLDGTTDVTRTLALGNPSAEMRDRFTRVLKGHIALASIRFPEGTTGAELDILARQYLWERGLDYGHGTGHGVGCYLGVHEGPQSISKRNKIPLQPGMILSNEPGFYKPGAYGIRIENLQTVVEILGMPGPRKFYGFETLTLAPIDLKLVDVSLLSDAEIKWLNAYHLRVFQILRSMVDAPVARWLETATQPIGQ